MQSCGLLDASSHRFASRSPAKPRSRATPLGLAQRGLFSPAGTPTGTATSSWTAIRARTQDPKPAQRYGFLQAALPTLANSVQFPKMCLR